MNQEVRGRAAAAHTPSAPIHPPDPVRLTLLLLDPAPRSRAAFEKALRRAPGLDARVRSCGDLASALERLDDGVDVLAVVQHRGWRDDLRALTAAAPQLPLLLLGGPGDDGTGDVGTGDVGTGDVEAGGAAGSASAPPAAAGTPCARLPTDGLQPEALARALRRLVAGAARTAAPAPSHFERLIHALDEVAWSFDAASGRVNYLSRAAETVFGRPLAELLAAPELWLAMVHPEDRERVTRAWQALEAGHDFEQEYRIVRPDGAVRWLFDRGRAELGPDGRPQHLDGVAADITRLKEAEAQLRARETQLAGLLSTLSDVAWSLDLRSGESRILGGDTQRLYGRPASDFEADPTLWSAIIHPDDEAVVAHYYERLRRAGCLTVDYRVVRPDASVCWVRCRGSVLRDERGEVVGLQGVTSDLSDQRALRSSELRLEEVLASLSDGLLITDLDDTIRYVNSRVCEMSGYRREELIGRRGYEVLLDPAQHQAMRERNRERDHGESGAYRIDLRRRDGTTVPTESRGSPLRDPDGRVIGTIGLISDISERVAQEEALRDSRAQIASLLDEAQRRGRELELLNHAASRLAEASTLDAVGRTVVEVVHRVLGYPSICFALLQEDALVPQHWVGYGPLAPLPRDRGLCGLALRERRTVLVEDVSRHPDYVAFAEGVAANLVVPLYEGGRPAGVLVVETGADTPLEARDARLLEAVGRQVDVALERAALYGRLKASEAQLRGVIEAAVDPISIKDAEGRYLRVNRALCDTLGRSEHEIIGRRDDELLPRGYAVALGRVDREVLGGGEPRSFERVAPSASGEERTYITTAYPLRDAHDAISGLAAISRDISERKRAEQLEVDRRLAMEMVVADAPLERTLSQVAHLIERQLIDSCCLVTVEAADGHRLLAAPSLPPELRPLLRRAGSAAAAGDGVALLPTEELPAGDPWASLAEHGFTSVLRHPIHASERWPRSRLWVLQRRRSPRAATPTALATAAQLATLALEHRDLLERLTYQARHDALTGLPNRLTLEQKLDAAIASRPPDGAAESAQLALLFIDLDRFKHINDTLGHQIGDRLLQAVAKRLRDGTRRRDLLARLGGDEFALLITDLRAPTVATRVAQKLLEMLESPFEIDGHELFVTASIGVSLFPDDAVDGDGLLAAVDRAMYRAKAAGRNAFAASLPDPGPEAQRSLELENHLRRALDKREFELHLQPKIDLASGEAVGVEALLRWRHSERGLVSPGAFVPLAEETGLIVPIGEWVLREACRQGVAWLRRGLPPLRFAVNVSALQFCRSDFVHTVESALAESGLDPALLELEVTESVVMHDIDTVAARLQRLRSLGIGIAIDDFGTGYSSMQYLKRLPVDVLKIDRTFIADLQEPGTERSAEARSSAALIEALVTLARGLDLAVVAEGVETEAQRRVLGALGCEQAQGFLFGRPVPFEVLAAGWPRGERPRPAPIAPAGGAALAREPHPEAVAPR